MNQDDLEKANKAAANRLHHLSMRYVGALLEAATGKAVGTLPSSHPGLSECRDLIDLVLLCRAEINALTKCLIDSGTFTAEKFGQEVTDNYDWLAKQKAAQLGVEVTDYGLKFTFGE